MLHQLLALYHMEHFDQTVMGSVEFYGSFPLWNFMEIFLWNFMVIFLWNFMEIFLCEILWKISSVEFYENFPL
jgi:hypothetical protein